jgi:hypothetical protein
MKTAAALWHEVSVNTTSPKHIGRYNTWRLLWSIEDRNFTNCIVLFLFSEVRSDCSSREDTEQHLTKSL